MIPIFDGHNNTVLKHLADPGRDVFTPGPELSAPWAHLNEVEGLPVPPPFGAIEHSDAVRHTNAAVATLLGWAADPGGRFRLVRSAQELRRCLEEEVMAGILHFEG